jgi:hypothetical protein
MPRLSAARAISMRPDSFFGLHRARDIFGDQFRQLVHGRIERPPQKLKSELYQGVEANGDGVGG